MLRVLVIFLLIIGLVAAEERLPSKCVICRINEKQLNKRRSVQRSTSWVTMLTGRRGRVGAHHLVLFRSQYSRTPLFRTRLIRSPRYFEGRSNSLGFTLMFSVIYCQLFRTRLFRIPRYFELIVLSLHLKSTLLFRTCQKQSTHIRAQLETYCILFKLVLRN